MEQSGFAAAVGTCNNGELSRRKGKGTPFHCQLFSVGKMNIFGFQFHSISPFSVQDPQKDGTSRHGGHNTDGQLLFAGIDVGTAYMAIHKDDVLSGAMQATAKNVEQKIANKIAAGNHRPAENGTSGQSAAVIKADPSKWSRADRDEVRRRVARGEKISL